MRNYRFGKIVLIGLMVMLAGSFKAQAATGQRDSSRFTVDNRNTASVPIVTSVSSQYVGSNKHSYFLSGVSLEQTFTATINWNGKTPSQVRWYRNNTLIGTNTVSGNSAQRKLNVGTWYNAGDKFYVEAVSSDNTTSSKYRINFDIIPTPPGIAASMLTFSGGKYRSASFSMNLPSVSEILVPYDKNNQLTQLAQIGLSGDITTRFEIDLNGYANINATNLSAKADGFKVAGISLAADVGVALNYSYSNGQWRQGGILTFKVDGEYETPTYYVFIFGVPGLYIDCILSAGVDSQWQYVGGNIGNPEFSGDMDINAGIEAIAGAGIKNAVNVELFGRGNLHFFLQVPDKPYLKDWYVDIGGGAQWQVFFMNGDIASFQYRWPETAKSSIQTLNIPEMKDFQPMTRNYLENDYAHWHGDIAPIKPMDTEPLDYADFETTLQTNIFGQSNAILATSGETKCLVWLYDEPSRNSLDRTMLVYSINDGSGWSEPAAIDDDGTADVTPALSVDFSGNFVAAWASASELIPDGTDLSNVASKMNIKMATYDINSDSWVSETVVAQLGLDYNPNIASINENEITIIWTYDASNDILGHNPPATNMLLSRTKTVSGWQNMQILDNVVGLINFTDVEIDEQGISHIVYCVDTDSNLETDSDNELFYINNAGGFWSSPVQLTVDEISDVNPQFVKSSLGLMLVWARDGKIVSATDFIGMTDIAEVVSRQGSSGQRGFVSAVSPTDNISVIWNDTSSAGSDLFTVTYDPTMQMWSEIVQITDNRDMERSISAAYSADDSLMLAYNKVHILEGDGLEVFGQVDLCVYEYTIGADIEVVEGSIVIDDPNAVPGETVNLLATIANVGDTFQADIPVAFYLGDSAEPENQIGQLQLISGTLAAGESADVSVSWTIPQSDEPLNVIVVADPDLQIEDKNRANNAAEAKFFKANLALTNVVVNKADRGGLYVSADVVNNGFVSVEGGLEYDLRIPGNFAALDKQLTAPLEPGEHHSMTLTATSYELPYGEIELEIIIDPSNTIEQMSTADTTRLISITNLPSFDIDGSGEVNTADFALFAMQWQRIDCQEPDWCEGADFNLSGTVGIVELSMMAEAWLQEN